MAPASLKEAAERTLEQYGVLGISVEAVIDIDACRTSRRLRQYGMIRLSTFARVRRAGFALIATFDHPHFTLLLSERVGGHARPPHPLLRRPDTQPRSLRPELT